MATEKTAIVLLADGVEEIECLTAVNVLRRGGVQVTLAGLKTQVKGRSDICIVADILLENTVDNDFDAVVIPGGLVGVQNLGESEAVKKLLIRHECSNKLISAICAGPLVLNKIGVAASKTITSYPSVKKELETNYKYSEEPVVVDGNLITSRGPGTSMAFALCILGKLMGKEVEDRVATGLLYRPYQ